MWKRHYEHVDSQKGLAWSLSVHDYDLLARSEGDCREARDLLLAEWRTRFAYNYEGEEWFKRVTKMFEDREARKKTELAERIAAREQPWKCECGAGVDRTEFQEACPSCGKRLS
jgi:rubrerythrin